MRLLRDTCRSIRDLLPLHVGGDLEPGQSRRVDEHLHLCLSCFREFRELATMRGRLGVLAEQPLPTGLLDDFTEQVMARIAIGEAGPAAELPRVRRRLALPRRPLAAAAMLLVALSLGLALGVQWGERGPAGVPVDDGARPLPGGDAFADAPAEGPLDGGAAGWPAAASLPQLGIPVADFATPGKPRRIPSLRLTLQPVPEPGMRFISTRDRQFMEAFPPALRPGLLQGCSDGLVPDTDPERQLRLRRPEPDSDG